MTGEGSYKRVLLKISGEVLMGDGEFGLNPETVDRIAGMSGGPRGVTCIGV